MHQNKYMVPKVAYKMVGKKGKRVCDAFAKGAGAEIVDPYRVKGGEIATYGIRRGSADAIKNSENFWYMDHGYFGKRGEEDGSEYWRITRNHQTHDGEGDHGWDRFNSFNYDVKEWNRSGKNIVIVPPGVKMAKFNGCLDWLTVTLSKVPLYTDRPIVICKKEYVNRHSPEQLTSYIEDCTIGKCGAPYYLPLKQALKNAWVLITFCSNAYIDALINGIPVITNYPNNVIGDFKKIENPVLDRTCLKNLAYNQWTLEEIRSGKAWEELNMWG